jgi:DNA (cytosine-5)-methyltransferase 1
MEHKQLNTFHLFAGAGGGILADLLLGHNPIGACEIEQYPRDVLLARQRDGILPNFPIWDDVCTLDGKPWRGTVDVLAGGFPCQDISAAGKGAGISGERSGLWKEYARLIEEIQPRFVFAENSPLLRTRGLGVVLKDLASLGYNARWGVLGARDVGAPHKRDRMWVLAYRSDMEITCSERVWSDHRTTGDEDRRTSGEHVPTLRQAYGKNGSDRTKPASEGETHLAYPNLSRDGASRRNPDGDWSEIIKEREDESQLKSSRHSEEVAYPRCQHGQKRNTTKLDSSEEERSHGSIHDQSIDKGLVDSFWHNDPAESPTEPLVGRVADGVAHRIHRLKAIGNGQVPQCAAVAFNILSRGLI